MSEYQYYEFAALDQPLSKQQQAELRALSSRAVITASGFRNEYHWGDLKGDPHDWMKRYFDAHVYSAGWASCSFMLRLPGGILDKTALADYAAGAEGGAFSAAAAGSYCILDWSFDDDSGDAERFYDEQDGPGWMARLLPLREELLRGDMRPLYLGWLARLCDCELDDDELEPPLPAGLGALSPAQSALAEFLELDPDLLAAAAAASAAPPARGDALRAAKAWAAELPEAELRAAMVQLVTGQGRELERSLGVRHAAWLGTRQAAPARRTVGQIEAGRGAAEQLRLERERVQRAAREARLHAERVSRLAEVAAQAEAVWRQADRTLADGTGAAYGKAIAAVGELAQALAAEGRGGEFQQGLARLQESHGNRPAWVKRLKAAGLL
jgi:hypothetical protein